MHHVGAGNKTQVICHSRKCPLPPSHLISPRDLACFKINIKGKNPLTSGMSKKQIIWIFYYGDQELSHMAPNSKQIIETCVRAPSSMQLYMLPRIMFRWTYIKTSRSLSIIPINSQFTSMRSKRIKPFFYQTITTLSFSIPSPLHVPPIIVVADSINNRTLT